MTKTFYRVRTKIPQADIEIIELLNKYRVLSLWYIRPQTEL